MNNYITAAVIKNLRERRGLTQTQLGDAIGVSGKAVSKWETGKGLPDISLIEPLAKALGVSVMELMAGQEIQNQNVACNMMRTKLYVCPVCGNILCAAGAAVISCCGITLPPLEAEEMDEAHRVLVERVEDEQFLQVNHPMTKAHHISFLAWVTADRVQVVKLYPEGDAQTRIPMRGHGILYLYCNRDGLMKKRF